MTDLTAQELNWLHTTLPLRLGGRIVDDELNCSVQQLPFYEGGLLVRFSTSDSVDEYLLIGGSEIQDREVFRLIGDSRVIHGVNEEFGVDINKETVLDYLRFFCAQIGNEDGRFPIVENKTFKLPDDVIRADTLRIMHRSNEGFICKGSTMHRERIYSCVFLVTVEGFVEMLNDDGGRGPVTELTPRPKVYA